MRAKFVFEQHILTYEEKSKIRNIKSDIAYIKTTLKNKKLSEKEIKKYKDQIIRKQLELELLKSGRHLKK